MRRQNTRKVRKILVVDDNEHAAAALRKLFEIDGYEAHAAHDGDTALMMAQELGPDAIILDIALPGRDGYEIARILRNEMQYKALLIALTGYYGRDEDKEKAEGAGFDYHLTKPILAAEIEEHFK